VPVAPGERHLRLRAGSPRDRREPGFATALTAVDRSAVTGGDPSPTSPLPPGFSILVVLGGAGRLVTESGELELRRGRTALVPYSAGEGELDGELDVLRCLPSEASP
jgi:mannose-6-phosphate isomerase